MHYPGGNATDPIWRALASSNGISSWTPLKPQHSNPNPNPLATELWSIDFLTPPTPLIIPHRLPAFLESLMPLKNWCSIHARCSKSSLKHSIRFCDIFPSLKQNFIVYSSSKVSSRPVCICEIHQLWQSGFSRVYSNCCCSCSFESEIIKVGQSSHKMYSNNILKLQESTTILNACTKNVWKLIEGTTYILFHLAHFIHAVQVRIKSPRNRGSIHQDNTTTLRKKQPLSKVNIAWRFYVFFEEIRWQLFFLPVAVFYLFIFFFITL